MILDAQTLLADTMTLVTTSGTTVVSTNTIDLGAAGSDVFGNTITPDPGRSRHAQLLIQITTAVTSAGAATLRFDVITSASADLSSPTIICSTIALAKTVLVAGYKARLGIPPGLAQRYLGVQYTCGTADTTAGNFTAGIVSDVETVVV